MSTRALIPWSVLWVLAALTSSAWADEAAGRMFARQAQQALADGEPERAMELLQKARIEWPGAPVVAHTMADAHYRQGDYATAMLEYDKGSAGALAFRAFFNKGVTLHALAETKLAEAGVPLDPAGIPADVEPGPMIEAIDTGLETLEYSRGQFLDALADTSDAGPGDASAGRESVSALNKRMDDLREMKEELERREQEQEEQESEDENEEGEDSEDSEDQEGDGEQGEDGEDGEQDEQDEQDQQDGEGEPEQQEGEQDEPQEPTEPQQTEPVPGQQTQLSPQEMAQLLEQLEELEERARMMQRVRRAQQRQDVERDW